ncbi:MAG: RNA polymerase sigma factor [Chitinophagaceae bacterium]
MSYKENISEQELFKLFVDSNKAEKHFRELMKRFSQRVYWQVRRILIVHSDTDEVVQTVFIKLWQNAESFRFDSSISSYIFRIAYNESMNFLKQKKRFQSLDELLDTEGYYYKQLQSGEEINPHSTEAKLQAALLTLPEKQRQVFLYRYFDELPYKDISEITGTSEGALKASYHHATEKIKEYLKDN